MYSQEAISYLKQRIGFGSYSEIPVTVDPIHKIGTSGRLFSYFHKLVTLENLYATVPKIDLEQTEFNEYLEQLKQDAVLAVLTRILNQNIEYRSEFDYSDILLFQPELFDDAIGYTLAVTAIEQMVSTGRVNDNERTANLAYNKLKIELEGMVDDNGRVVAQGINRVLNYSIRKATDIIFPPKNLIIEDAKFW